MSLEPKAVLKMSSPGTRRLQEDEILVDRDKGLFVIADGFGGAEKNKTSELACKAVVNFLHHQVGDREATLPFVLKRYHSLAGNVLFNALTYANDQIYSVAKEFPKRIKGGASVIAAYLDADTLALANLGVCEAWLSRDGKIKKLVEGRSYARVVDPFREEPLPSLAIPLRSLGTSPDVEPEIVEVRIRPGDWLFLQSDGIPKSYFSSLVFDGVLAKPLSQALESSASEFKELTLCDNAAGLLVAF